MTRQVGHYSKGSVIQVIFHTENQAVVVIDSRQVLQELPYEELSGKAE